MINYQIDKNKTIIRQALRDTREAYVEATNEDINKTLNYFERVGDTEILRDAMEARFATYIEKDEDTGGFESYTNRPTAVKIQQGFYETINSGIGAKICKARRIFGNTTSYYEYTDSSEGGDKRDTSETEETINTQRNAGGYNIALNRADYISCAVETGPMLVGWQGGHLTYTPFSPSCLHMSYGNLVVDDGVERGPDYTSIEDAIRIVIQLNTLVDTSRPDEQQYLAIYGRSEEYQYGRYVIYKARDWRDVPAPGKSGIDWTTASGEIANPLSWYAATSDNDVGIEYPIVLFSGGFSLTPQNAMPVSTSLLDNTLEIDIALSRCLKDALSNALGIKHITNPSGQPLPRCLEGTVVTYRDQTLQLLSGDASGNQVALDITKNVARALAEGYCVPGYQLFSESGTAPESGIALYLRAQPLREHWNERCDINAANIERVFEIERRLYEVYTGTELAPYTVSQVWHPGRFMLPESTTDKLARITAARDAGLMDKVRAVMELYDLPTIQAAKDFIDAMIERDKEYPNQTTKPQSQAAALTAGLAPRPPRKVPV